MVNEIKWSNCPKRETTTNKKSPFKFSTILVRSHLVGHCPALTVHCGLREMATASNSASSGIATRRDPKKPAQRWGLFRSMCMHCPVPVVFLELTQNHRTLLFVAPRRCLRLLHIHTAMFSKWKRMRLPSHMVCALSNWRDKRCRAYVCQAILHKEQQRIIWIR